MDVAVWAGLVPENAHDPALLQSLLDHGAAGFKSFMSPAGPFQNDPLCTKHVQGHALKTKGTPELCEASNVIMKSLNTISIFLMCFCMLFDCTDE